MYRFLADGSLPRRLRPWYCPVSGENLPYMYPSVKRKCWEDEPVEDRPRKKCTKTVHSCHRSIISFIRMPHRKVYRRVGRATHFYIQSVWKSKSLCGLATAASKIKQGISKLHYSTSCYRCAKPRIGLACHTEDAGQAYEVAETRLINYVLREFCRAVDRSYLPYYVAVSFESKSHVYFVPTLQQTEGAQTFHFFDIVRCLVYVLQMRIYKLGPEFVTQCEGFPIGGPLSFTFLDLILSFLEHLAFDFSPGPTAGSENLADKLSQLMEEVAAGIDQCISRSSSLLSSTTLPSCPPASCSPDVTSTSNPKVIFPPDKQNI